MAASTFDRLLGTFGLARINRDKRDPIVIHRESLYGSYGEPPPRLITEPPSLYAQSPAVYESVNAQARRLGAADLVLYRLMRDGREEEVTTHPLLDLLMRPNMHMTRAQFFWHLVADYHLAGNSYWFLAGPASGKPNEIWRMNPRRTQIVRSKQDFLAGYVTIVDEVPIPLFPDEVAHLRQPNPFDETNLYGMPTLYPVMDSAGTEIAMTKWNRSGFEQDRAVPTGILNVQNWIGDAEFDELKRSWRENYGGGLQSTAFLRGGQAQFQTIGLSQRELDFVNGLGQQKDAIYRIFGCYHLVTAQNTSAEATQSAERHFIDETLWPIAQQVTDWMTATLAPYFGPVTGAGRLRFAFRDFRPRERGIELEEKRERVKMLTVNEARAVEDLPPIEGGDGLMYVHMVGGYLLEGEETPGRETRAGTQVNPENPDGERQSDADSPEMPDETAERFENENSMVSDGVGNTTQAKAADVLRELAQWQRWAIRRVGSNDLEGFTTEVIPLSVSEVINEQLTAAMTPEHVKGVFDPVFDFYKGGGGKQKPKRGRLPQHVEAYLKVVSPIPDDTLDLTASTQRHVYEQECPIDALKAIGMTQALYRSILFNVIGSALDLDSQGRPVMTQHFFNLQGRRAIDIYFKAAFLDGLAASGGNVLSVPAELVDTVESEIKAEHQYWKGLSSEIYGDAIPLYVDAVKLMEAGDIAQARILMESYQRVQAGIMRRIALWVNKGVRRMYNMGMMYASDEQMLRWDLGLTEEHCQTCYALNGQVHSASDWRESGFAPQGSMLECGGYNCDCRFTAVDGAETGEFPPLVMLDY